MTENMNHIISRLSCNTSFDQKEKGVELQSRLSSLSRNRIQREMAEVFDRVCPPKEVWKIQRLELDLGIIDYNELEQEFSFKLRKQLQEKLQELVSYAKNNESSGIEILTEDLSRLGLLYTFLLNGVMPWNYRATIGSVNQVLGHQLLNNRHQLTAMLLELGATRESVRKRIAWQVSEENIIKIIEALEPGNSKHIIEFSNDVANIQAKDIIVQASTADFKKNLWLWVLNYLMKNHGSQFNKKQFLKSSIRQMADHYNTGYDELFAMIEDAVKKAVQLTAVHADFILTLEALSNERKTEETHNLSRINDIDQDQWNLLRNYFLNALPQGSFARQKEFNELVIRFSKQEKKAFNELINSLRDSRTGWLQAADQLDSSSLEAIMQALDPSGRGKLVAHIHFLDALCREAGLLVDRKIYWQTSISYLLRYRDAKFNIRSFMYYCANKLQSRNNKFYPGMIGHLINKGMPGNIKTIAAFEMYKELTAVLVSGVLPGDAAYKKQLSGLINELRHPFAAGIYGGEKFMVLQKQLIRAMRMFPKTALQAILEFRDKDKLQQLMPYLFEEDTAILLMKHTKKGKPAIILYVSQLIVELKADKTAGALAAFIGRDLFSTGLQLMILNRGMSQSEFLELLLEKLYQAMPVSVLGQFDLFVYKLVSSNKLLSYGISAAVVERIRSTYYYNRKPFAITGIIQLIKASAYSQARVGDLLNTDFENNEFAQWRRDNRQEAHTIINYFLTGGAHIKQDITEKYTRLLGHELKTVSEIEIHYRVNELFWKCILDYRSYAGYRKKFDGVLRKAFVMNFGVQEHDILSDKRRTEAKEDTAEILTVTDKKDIRLPAEEEKPSPGNKPAGQGNKSELPGRKLLQAARLGILQDLCSSLILEMKLPAWYDDGPAASPVKDLVNEIVYHYPAEFLTALKSGPITASGFYWLSSVLDFKILSGSVGRLNPGWQAQLHILCAFYELLGKMTMKSLSPKQIQEIIFKKLLHAWATGNLKIIMIENILTGIFHDLVIRSGISKQEIITDFNKYRAYLPQPLQIAFEELKGPGLPRKEETAKPVKPALQDIQKKNAKAALRHGIEVKNAGLVLVSSYIILLFERLGLTAAHKFRDAGAQSDAVHYLQYIVTGFSNTDESFLPLNKLLCGLPLEQPVPAGIEIPWDQKLMIDGLISAIIGYWSSIGNTSVDGFRGNWLVRTGLLSEQDDKWELTVEKRSYDVLLNRSPFSFSIIKYPWMDKPLHVNWSY